MNQYAKEGLKTLLASCITMVILFGTILYANRSRQSYDINKERFKPYNDSPLVFKKYIRESVVYRNKK